MSHVDGSSLELARIEEKYEDICDDSSALTEPIRSSWQRKKAQMAHNERPLPTQPKERALILPFLPDSADKQIKRESYRIMNERSRDQLLEILHEAAQLAVAESNDRSGS